MSKKIIVTIARQFGSGGREIGEIIAKILGIPLIDKELIHAVGRLDAPGRPMLYGTTEKFLRVFGLNSLKELPNTELMTLNVDASGEVDTSQLVMQIPTEETVEKAEESE